MNARLKVLAIAICILSFIAVVIYFISNTKQGKKTPVSIEPQPELNQPTVTKTPPDEPGKMIAGILASNKSGKFAAERPADLDPYSRWVPPIARQAWLDKTDKILNAKAPAGARVEKQNIYFHLGFKDKPATCGEIRFVQEDVPDSLEFQRFIYTGRGTHILEKELPAAFDELWQKLCVEKLYEW